MFRHVSAPTPPDVVGDHKDRPSISADGRYVAFASIADNLVRGDTNVQGDGNSGMLDLPGPPSIDADVFRRDLERGNHRAASRR